MNSVNAKAGAEKRRFENEMQTLTADLDEMLNETKHSEEKAKKAMVDAARLADELRAEQDHVSQIEKARKSLETTVKDLQSHLETAQRTAATSGKQALAKVEQRVQSLTTDLQAETSKHA